MECYDVKEVGSGPIITAIYQQLKVRETANRVLPWDGKQCLLDPGTHLVALINNILSTRGPLYRVEEFYREQDTELLFGPGVEADHFNDDALGKSLDRIYKTGPKKFFSAVVTRVMVEEEIVTVKRTRRGCPRKDEQPVTRRVYRFRLQIGELDQEAYLEAKISNSAG